MRTRLTIIAAVAGLALAACGGVGGDQGEVADLFIELAGDEGLELDESCVEDAAAKLSDEDAAAIVEAGTEGDPDVSEEADAIGEEIFDCISVSSYRDSLIDSIAESDPTVDADCIRDAVGDLETVAELEDEIFGAAMSCSGGG